MAPITAITIVAMAAVAAMLILLLSVRNGSSRDAKRGGKWWVPTTLSRTIFSGQGEATLIVICTSIAPRIAARFERYGRNKLAIRGNMVSQRVPGYEANRRASQPSMVDGSVTQQSGIRATAT